MLLLSKTKKILGNFGSTFTEMAWFFGKCKPEIEIVIDSKELKEFRLKEKEEKKFINRIKRFFYELIIPRHVRILDKK